MRHPIVSLSLRALPIAATLLSASFISASLSAQTYVSESFAGGERSTQNPPSSLQWYSSTSASDITMADGSLTMTGANGMNGTQVKPAQHIVANFATGGGSAATIGIGQTLSLSVTFQATGGIGAGDILYSVRTGLFNSNGGAAYTADAQNPALLVDQYTGYAGNLLTNTASENLQTQIRRREKAGVLITAGGAYSGALNTSAPMTDTLFDLNTSYTLVLSLDRLSDKVMTITYTLSGGDLENPIIASFTESSVSASYLTYDTIAISYWGNNNNGIHALSISDISLVMVPEPALALLALPLAAFGCVWLRRRRARQV